MKATLVAHTQLAMTDPVEGEPYTIGYEIENYMALDATSTQLEDLVEFAGRACYQSFHKPNPRTANNQDYVASIVEKQHFSVLEHASATFYIEGVSRALTHELIRHRHLSYSELSQRFVNVENAEMVIPPALADDNDLIHDELLTAGNYASATYEAIVSALLEKGLTRKQAREAARAVMPNAVETRIVVTGNLRAWRDFLTKRWHVAADAEIQQLAGVILSELRGIAPSAFLDVPRLPYGTED